MSFVLRMAVRETRSSWRRLLFFFLCTLVAEAVPDSPTSTWFFSVIAYSLLSAPPLAFKSGVTGRLLRGETVREFAPDRMPSGPGERRRAAAVCFFFDEAGVALESLSKAFKAIRFS